MSTKLCECGCGKPAPIAIRTSAQRSAIKGQARRFISGHNLKVNKHRNPKLRPLSVRFWSQVNKKGPVHPVLKTRCWLWTGAKNNERVGRGVIGYQWKTIAAPRVAWFLATGKWPTNDACHHCDNPPCVRFSHLFDGTAEDNGRDMSRKGRSGTAKLTWKKVVEIRRLYTTGRFSQMALALKFGVSQSVIWNVVTHRTWRIHHGAPIRRLNEKRGRKPSTHQGREHPARGGADRRLRISGVPCVRDTTFTITGVLPLAD